MIPHMGFEFYFLFHGRLCVCRLVWSPGQLYARRRAVWGLIVLPSAAAGPGLGRTCIPQRPFPAGVPVGLTQCQPLPIAPPLPTYGSIAARRRAGTLGTETDEVVQELLRPVIPSPAHLSAQNHEALRVCVSQPRAGPPIRLSSAWLRVA